MAAIEGDGSPESYIQASLLARELREFGVRWHGCDWSTQEILDKNPQTHTMLISARSSPTDVESLRPKARFAQDRGLAGLMFWEYMEDAGGKLLTAIHETFRRAR